MAIKATNSDGGAASQPTIVESIAKIKKDLKKAQANYDADVKSKQPAFVIAASKAVLDEAEKGYALTEPLRKDIIAADPDVKAGKELIAAAQAEVAATTKSIAEAKTALAQTIAANNPASGKPVIPPAPGKAWYWDGTEWVKPLLPSDGKNYDWDNETGWTLNKSDPFGEFSNFNESTTEAENYYKNYTPDPDNLTPEQSATLVPFDSNEGLGVTGNLAVEASGKYTYDIKTGILLLDGQPYSGSYNGYDYEGGEKKSATTKEVVNLNTDGSPLEPVGPTDAELARMDAFAQLQDLFESYNLGSLAGKITEYMKEGKGPNETVLLLKQSPEYNLRFQGNTLRKAAGLNVMDEASYLALENSYANTLRNYGLGNMLSTDRTKNEAMYSKWMGNDLAAPEFQSRIKLATDRVMNADSMTRDTFKQFYPTLTDADLVSYFLAPKDTLSRLEEKVTAAEIGGVATGQGLTTDLTSATELAKFGIDRAAAIQGYSNIKDVLPVSQKLGNIYNEADIKYNQATGEEEFLKLNADAGEKRRRLKSLERAAFQGETGISQGSGLVRSVQGKF